MSVNFREDDPAPSKEVDELFFDLASFVHLCQQSLTTRRPGAGIRKYNKQLASLTLFSESFG